MEKQLQTQKALIDRLQQSSEKAVPEASAQATILMEKIRSTFASRRETMNQLKVGYNLRWHKIPSPDPSSYQMMEEKVLDAMSILRATRSDISLKVRHHLPCPSSRHNGTVMLTGVCTVSRGQC